MQMIESGRLHVFLVWLCITVAVVIGLLVCSLPMIGLLYLIGALS